MMPSSSAARRRSPRALSVRLGRARVATEYRVPELEADAA